MRTKAGDFNLNVDIPDAGWETSVTVTHNDPSGNVEIEYDYGSTVNIASGNSSGKYWANAWTDPLKFRFSTFDAYMTELELDGNIGVAISQVPPQLTSYKHTGGDINHPLQMKGTSLPSGLTDLWLSDLRSPFDTDRVITALEDNAQTNGTLFIAEQRLGKTTDLLESRGWDVEIEPDIIHRIEQSTAPHTSVIDGKVVHHVDRRRGGDRRKQWEGRCIELNGTSEYAATSTSIDLCPSAMTVSCWVKVDRSSGDAIVSKGLNSQWGLFLQGTVLYWRVGSTGSDLVTSATADGNWHHVAATVDGTSGVLYYDGVAKSTGTVNAMPANDGATAVMIGKLNTVFNSANSHAHVRIYDTALTAAQIAALAAEASQLPLATGLPTPLIDLPMDDATTSPIIRNHGSLGQAGDFTLTGTPSSIWTTCDRVSLPNEHGCSVGLVTDGSTGYLDTGITLDGATSFTILRELRYLSKTAYDLDGFVNSGASAVRYGRDTGGDDYYANAGKTATTLNGGGPVTPDDVFDDSFTAESGGDYKIRVNGANEYSASAGTFTVSNSRGYWIGASNGATLEHPSHAEYTRYLIADRVLTDDEITYWRTRGESGTPFDSATDPNILGDYDFQSPDPHTVANLADPGNPAKIVGGCEWVAINRDAANPTLDMNGKALTFSGPVKRDAVILSPVATLNGTSEYIESGTGGITVSGYPFGMGGWFKSDGTTGNHVILSLNVGAGSGEYATIANNADDDVLRILRNDDTGGSEDFDTTLATTQSQWHHCYVQFNSATAVDVYLDGVKESFTGLSSSDVGNDGYNRLLAGVLRTTSPAGYFEGGLAGLRLHLEGLTDAQVVTLASGGTVEGAEIDWPLCEGAGDVALDISGSGNHGTITGSVWDGDQQDKSDVLITNGFAKGTIYDGSSDYFSRATLVGGANRLCFSWWQLPGTLGATNHYVFGEYNTSSNRSVAVGINTDGSIRLLISGDGDTVDSVYSDTGVITADELQHLMVIWDAGAVSFYRNGVAIGTGTTTATATFESSAEFHVGDFEGASAKANGTLSQILVHKDPTVAWSTETKAAIRAAGKTEDIAAIVENLGGTAWYFPDGDSNETLQGLSGFSTNGSPTETIIPAGAGVPISYGPGVPAPGQSRLIAPEPNSPFALRYAKDYQLDEGALAYEAVFSGSTNYADLGSILIGASNDFDISLDVFVESLPGSGTESILSQLTGGVSGRFHIAIANTSVFRFFVDNGSDDVSIDSGSVSLNRWYSLRFTRVGDVFAAYLDGDLIATQTEAGVSVEQSNAQLGNDEVADFHGKIRNVRIDNNGTVTEYLTQNIALPGATLTNVTVNSVNHGVVGGRQLFFNSDGTANLYETPMSAEMTEVIATNPNKYS